MHSLYEVTGSRQTAEETNQNLLFSIIAIKELTAFVYMPFDWAQRHLTSFLDTFYADRAENKFRVLTFCVY